MKDIDHHIYLELNCMGFRGSEIDEILPDFMSERPTYIGLTWQPSAEGTESFTLGIIIGTALSPVVMGFLTEVGKDLYKWVKSKLVPLFKKKGHPIGHINLEIGDIEISGLCEGIEETEGLLKLFSSLPELVGKIDPNLTEGEWEIVYNRKIKTWIIEYHPPKDIK